MKRIFMCLALTVSAAVLLTTNAFAVTVTGTAGNGWQTWGTGDLNENGTPYWDGGSYEGSQRNIGYYMTKSGSFMNTQNGPGVAYNYWGTSTGGSDPSIYFTRDGTGNSGATLEAEFTNFDGHHVDPGSGNPLPGNKFGWFETTSTGSSIGTMHQLFDSGLVDPVTSVGFNPSQYYGFYITNERGTFYTLSTFDTPDYFQHYSVFQESANAVWLGIEDLITNPPGREDLDYNDFIVRITSEPSTNVPDGGSTLLLLGSSLMALVGVAKMKFNTLVKK
jgi:hypothetical protein